MLAIVVLAVGIAWSPLGLRRIRIDFVVDLDEAAAWPAL
jgi:hypothetical protein